MWEYALERAGAVRDRITLVFILLGIAGWWTAYVSSASWANRYASALWATIGLKALMDTLAQQGSKDRLAEVELKRARVEHRQEWDEAELRWAALRQRGEDHDFLGSRNFPKGIDEQVNPKFPLLRDVPWPSQTDGRPVVVPRITVGAIYVLATLAVLALYGTRGLLEHIDTGTGLGPDQAPAIIATAVGLPGLVTAVIVAIPRVLRAWGAKTKDEGSGQADIIRAQKEGEADVIRAQAELRRAEAEFLRAQKDLDPLPAALPPNEPPAPLPTSNNGSAPEGATAQP